MKTSASPWSSTLMILLGTMCFCTNSTETAWFLLTPKAINATLNSTSKAHFQCVVAEGGVPLWYINGEDASNFVAYEIRLVERMDVEIGGQRGTQVQLSVPTTKMFNGSSIQCWAFVENTGWFSSAPALLLLQGLLDAPIFTHLTCQARHVTVTWSSPFTLDLTLEESDLVKYVFTVNGTYNQSSRTTVNTTSYATVLEGGFVEYCYRVSAVNRLGEGEKSPPACITPSNCTVSSSAPSTMLASIKTTPVSSTWWLSWTSTSIPLHTPTELSGDAASRISTFEFTIISIVVSLEVCAIAIVLIVLGGAAYKTMKAQQSGDDIALETNNAYQGAENQQTKSVEEAEQSDDTLERIYYTVH